MITHKNYKIYSKKTKKSIFPFLRVKRILVLIRIFLKSLSKTIDLDRRKLYSYQEKAIKLWKLCLKDSKSKLSYNVRGIRQIERGRLFITCTPINNDEYIMTIIDTNHNRKFLFEVHIPTKFARIATDYFDMELDRRMFKNENRKRSIIESDIDKLIVEQEKSITQKK